MYETSMLATAMLAGAIYTLTPGPAFLAVLGIGISQGRRAGLAFLIGHLLGDVLWASLALVGIIGAATISPLVFDLLGLVCGGYLLWLGVKAMAAGRRGDHPEGLRTPFPMRRGLIFGITNPKGYPVSVAMFTALLAEHASALSWANAPWLIAAAIAGFLAADLVLVWLVGLRVLGRLYRRHEVWILRVTGLMFVGFAVHALAHAGQGLLGRRP